MSSDDPSNGGDQTADRDARGRFTPGNRSGKGRATGSRNRATLLAAAVIEDRAELLAARCVRMALEGNEIALRLCVERLVPRCREKPVILDLPEAATARGVVEAQAVLLKALSEGEVTPAEAGAIAGVLGAQLRAVELAELEQRLADLEARLGGAGR